MLRYSLAATALLAAGLTACLDDPSGPQCQSFNDPVVDTVGDTIVTQAGLRYIEVEAGASQQEADWCQLAVVQYVGTLLDGTEFDSGTYDFVPGGAGDLTIPGFVLGVVGMQVNERRRLIIPPNLAYGAQGSPSGEVPPNATVVFDVQLISTQ